MNYERSKAPLALMEQIIMILVFALAAAICLQAYVYADKMSKDGQLRERASARAREVIEYCKATEGDLPFVSGRLSGEYGFGTERTPESREMQEAPDTEPGSEDAGDVPDTGAGGDTVPIWLTVDYPEDGVKVVLQVTDADRVCRKADVQVYDEGGEVIFSTRTAWQIGGRER